MFADSDGVSGSSFDNDGVSVDGSWLLNIALRLSYFSHATKDSRHCMIAVSGVVVAVLQ